MRIGGELMRSCEEARIDGGESLFSREETLVLGVGIY